jgi:hypothetical protein
MLHRVAQYSLSDVSEVLSTSITRALSTSEMLVNFYWTIWHIISEDSYFQTERSSALKLTDNTTTIHYREMRKTNKKAAIQTSTVLVYHSKQ